MQKTAHAIFGKMHFGQMIGSGMGGHGKQKKASVKTMHCALPASRLHAAALAAHPVYGRWAQSRYNAACIAQLLLESSAENNALKKSARALLKLLSAGT